MRAADIERLLAARHSSDVFIRECKDGPTHSVSRHGKIDAWVMRSSWTNPCFIGYEIKVSRQDFLRDEKWSRYLPMCNELYFVTPWKLVMPDEVPEQCGLLWVTNTGTRLHMKRKAQHRAIEPPTQVMMYALMCRAKIGEEPRRESSAEFWRQWLAERKVDEGLGDEVRSMISRRYRDELMLARDRASRAERRAASLEMLARECAHLGVSPDRWGAAETVVDHVTGRVPATIKKQARRLSKAATELVEAMEKYSVASE